MVTMTRWVWLALALCGCSSKDDSTPTQTSTSQGGNSGTNGPTAGTAGIDADAGTDPGGSVDATTPLVGSFAVTLVAATSTNNAFTSVLGRVYDAAVPDDIEMQLAAEIGDCSLWTPRIPFCDPACGGTEVCVADDECVPYPTSQDVGTITVTGLGDPFEMDPIVGAYQPPGSVAIDYPPSPPGTAVVLSATGGVYAPFTVQSTSIEPLELLGPEQIDLDPELPLTLTWTPPEDPAVTQVRVRMDISHHGGFKGEILCSTEDDGSLEIDAELLTLLVDLGVAGFPSITVTRAAEGATQIAPGRVMLTVSSGVERELLIAGLVSCNDNDGCDTGQTCATDRTCQ